MIGKESDRAALILAVVLVGYVALEVAVGRFSGFDEPFYKAAGREWAQSGQFAAPELEGLWIEPKENGFDPPIDEVYFAYMPLYTFLFGVLVKIVGFSWRVCVFVRL